MGHVQKAVVFTNTLADGTISSLGCGVVVFSTSEEAVRAADTLGNTILDNSVLQCHIIDVPDKTTVDEPSKEIARALHPHKVFVGGLPKEITADEITTLFSEAGTVKSVEILVSKKGHVLGFAEVEFSDTEGAQAALAKLNGREMEGRWIYVRELFVHADPEVVL